MSCHQISFTMMASRSMIPGPKWGSRQLKWRQNQTGFCKMMELALKSIKSRYGIINQNYLLNLPPWLQLAGSAAMDRVIEKRNEKRRSV